MPHGTPDDDYKNQLIRFLRETNYRRPVRLKDEAHIAPDGTVTGKRTVLDTTGRVVVTDLSEEEAKSIFFNR